MLYPLSYQGAKQVIVAYLAERVTIQIDARVVSQEVLTNSGAFFDVMMHPNRMV
ncbi:hypothetical protein N8Z26_03700 [Burkholderiales bacterium]|nr:hypothetical protein [Burkholderiales bacterium]